MIGFVAAGAVAAAGLNVMQYVDWQNDACGALLICRAVELPAWAQAMTDLARACQRTMNVGQRRDAQPVQDIANPWLPV
jgi:hypothetical protein